MPANTKPEFLFIHANSLPSPRHLPSPIFASVYAAGDGVTAVTPHFLWNRGFGFSNYGNYKLWAILA